MTQENLSKYSAPSPSQFLLKEIPSLTEIYPNTKKLSTSCPDGSVTMVVQLFHERNIFLRLQLSAQYPGLPPAISISSDCLTKTSTNDLIRLLEKKASSLKGHQMLVALANEGCRLIKPEESRAKTEVKKNKKFKCYKNVREAGVDQQFCMGDSKKSDSDRNEKIQNGVADIKIGAEFMSSYELDKSAAKKQERPTHFIAMRITNEAIVKNLEQVQKQLVEKEPLLAKGVFPKETFHITLCKLGLDTPDQILHCIQSLDQVKLDLKSSLAQAPLTVYSMSQFYNRAIYAKVKQAVDLEIFQTLLTKKLIDLGVEIRDEHEAFTPHVTIIKVKRPERKLYGSRNIQPSIYSHVIDTIFGEQHLDGLFLCTMDGERRSDGFYVTLHEISFQST